MFSLQRPDGEGDVMKIARPVGIAGPGLLAATAAFLVVLRERDLGEARRIRTRLERPDDAVDERFREELVADLPEPARRYFLHAIRPGTALARSVALKMDGELRLRPDGPWLPMQARQVLAPPAGFVWEAVAGRGMMRFSGADTYAAGRGRVAFRLWDLVPVARASGPDVSRSARGRLAGEAIWSPAALLRRRGVRWEAVDERTARATPIVDGEPIPLTLTVEPDGRLRSVTLRRWGDRTDDGRHALIPFGMDVLGEREFGGYTIPARVAGGWWYGTERFFDFFHGVIRRAEFS
jgi:hypothetical protein